MPFAYEPHRFAMPLQYITTALQPKLAGEPVEAFYNICGT